MCVILCLLLLLFLDRRRKHQTWAVTHCDAHTEHKRAPSADGVLTVHWGRRCWNRSLRDRVRAAHVGGTGVCVQTINAHFPEKHQTVPDSKLQKIWLPENITEVAKNIIFTIIFYLNKSRKSYCSWTGSESCSVGGNGEVMGTPPEGLRSSWV